MTGVAAAACSNSQDAIAARINGEWQKNFGHLPNWGARHAIIGDLSHTLQILHIFITHLLTSCNSKRSGAYSAGDGK